MNSIRITLLSIFSVTLLLQVASAEEQVYLTKEHAFELLFGRDVAIQYDPQIIPTQLSEQLDDLDLLGAKNQSAHFFVGRKANKILGYALIDAEVGKHLPITYIVGISPEGNVTRVEIMIYREAIGWEARERTFMQQFEGKHSETQIELGNGIRHVTGATISSRSITKGVKRALFLWRYFYAGERKIS